MPTANISETQCIVPRSDFVRRSPVGTDSIPEIFQFDDAEHLLHSRRGGVVAVNALANQLQHLQPFLRRAGEPECALLGRQFRPRRRGQSLNPILVEWILRKAHSRDCNVLAEIHILNEVQHLDALLHGPLEGFAAADEAHAAGSLVDDRGSHRFGKIVLT